MSQSLDFYIFSFFFRVFWFFVSFRVRFTIWLMTAGWPMPSRSASHGSNKPAPDRGHDRGQSLVTG